MLIGMTDNDNWLRRAVDSSEEESNLNEWLRGNGATVVGGIAGFIVIVLVAALIWSGLR